MDKKQKKEFPHSGVPGVTWRPREKQWLAMHKQKYLGQFPKLEDAIAARKASEAAEKPRFCKICGKPIPNDWHYRIIYCSDDCRKKGVSEYSSAYYNEHREEGTKRRVQIEDGVGVSLYMPRAMIAELRKKADQEQKTISQYLRDLIQREINKEEGTE